MRVDHATLERVLPGVREIVSSGAPMVKRCDGIKTVIVVRIVFALLILYAIFGLIRKTVSAPALWNDGGTHQASSHRTVGVFLGLEAATFRQHAKNE